ncbi:hypothetical protein C0992_000094 [Termitomyces sp. T32_za158]|nr:hypothetical protein C0992_000094 [Termitomyces sp. T32_za158]
MRTLITPWEVRPPSNKKPKIPSIVIPHTPINVTGHVPLINHHKIVQISTTPQFLAGGLSFEITKSSSCQESGMDVPAPDVLALAELFAALKRAVSRLHDTFEELGSQTNRLANFAPVLRIDQHIEGARMMLEQQIARHEKSIREVRHVLENAVHDSVVERLKAQIAESISDNVAKEVKRRVQQELSKQISERLERHGHTRKIFKAHTVLGNSEARRHNEISPCINAERLRPLLRPLPSALQSPVHILKLPLTANNSATVTSPLTPLSAMSATTTVAAVYAAGDKQVFGLVFPMPSPLFPHDIKPLFELRSGAASKPLTDHGLETVPYSGTNPNQPEVIRRVNINSGPGPDILNTDVFPPLEAYTTRERDIDSLSSMNHFGNVLSYATRPLWDAADGPKKIVSHYYAEGMKMDRHACQLHGWNEREARDDVKVMDAVLMSSELDLLEIRMNELDSVVDSFFIIESNATFTGLPKETYFAKDKDRFSKFEKKIVYKFLPGYPLQSGQVAWDVERWTRDNMTAMLRAHMSTLPKNHPVLVIMSDVDEIPSKHTIELLRACEYGEAIHLQLRNFLYRYVVVLTFFLWAKTNLHTIASSGS